MMDVRFVHKITPEKLARRAIVYLRQSSPRQVRENLESQRLQYGLVERARNLGWAEIETVDCDLGRSASIGGPSREGFNRVISSVALGEVGIVLSREVSRLSRTDKDWCQLLEVCQIFGTLIGDEEQVYDLDLIDDQLVLGIKGTMSVAELKILRQRMLRGSEEKARRGELKKRLPPGYLWDSAGRVVKDPDRRVQEAIDLVFERFREAWSLRRTLKWFRSEGIELPVNRPGHKGWAWAVPSHSLVVGILKNPFYAGAYCYGRRSVETVWEGGRLKKRMGRGREPEECRVFLRDHHEGYIGWQEFEENRRMIRGNIYRGAGEGSSAAVRAGRGLLVGLLRCGHCGRKLYVNYWGKRGTAPRYQCKGDFPDGGKYCLGFSGDLVERRFSEDLVAALSPLGVEASLVAMEEWSSAADDRQGVWKSRVEQLEYDERRAFEQYDEVDPRNRLVAAELERRWNAKLEELERAREKLKELNSSREVLMASDRERILRLGEQFSEVWFSEDCPMELKKKIVCAAVEDVIVWKEDDVLRFTIHWKGGVHTQFEIPCPGVVSSQRTSMEALDIIARMAVRYGDDQIAAVLNRVGLRTGKGSQWDQIRVATARRNHGIAGNRRTVAEPGVLNLRGAARYCGVSMKTIVRLVEAGILPKEQIVPFAPWEIKQADLDAKPVRSILQDLKSTGRLKLEGGSQENQKSLFPEIIGVDNARYRD